jgi:hypothetical protein
VIVLLPKRGPNLPLPLLGLPVVTATVIAPALPGHTRVLRPTLANSSLPTVVGVKQHERVVPAIAEMVTVLVAVTALPRIAVTIATAVRVEEEECLLRPSPRTLT